MLHNSYTILYVFIEHTRIRILTRAAVCRRVKLPLMHFADTWVSPYAQRKRKKKKHADELRRSFQNQCCQTSSHFTMDYSKNYGGATCNHGPARNHVTYHSAAMHVGGRIHVITNWPSALAGVHRKTNSRKLSPTFFAISACCWLSKRNEALPRVKLRKTRPKRQCWKMDASVFCTYLFFR